MTQTLVEQLKRAFETPKVIGQREPKTLAEYVSNQLMQNILPRISPELFELKRKAQVPLTDKQIKKIDGFFCSVFRSGRGLLWSLNRSSSAEIPRFVTAHIPEQKVIQFNESGKIIYSSEFIVGNTKSAKDNFGKSYYPPIEIKAQGIEMITNGRGFEHEGAIKIKSTLNWTAPFKLDVNIKVPEIPKEFIELGDEAIAEYYGAVRTAPNELRKTTRLVTPKIGVLWSPTDESLYATGKIPEPTPPRPKGDPALILDIPDEQRSYRHVVAVWNIGEERPFRNWLAEYSEGGR